MGGLLKRSLVWLLALLFFTSGIAARYCMAAHQSSFEREGESIVHLVEVERGHHTNVSQPGYDADQDRSGAFQQLTVDVYAAAHESDAACAKCCGTCTLAAATMPDAAAQVLFAVSRTKFLSRSDHCVGFAVRMDPEIPKRIV